jgi:hypothetical protein
MKMRRYLYVLFIFLFITGCAGIPVRKEVKEDRSLPVGKIEGSTFEGIRFPFKVSLPSPQWKFSVEIPDFMEELGFMKPGLEESELFVINPATHSNIQIDLTPAGKRARFNQRVIEGITATAYNGLLEELKMDHGRDFRIEGGPPTPYLLKGVQYAAHQFVKYKVRETRTIHGWVYGFTEPYQIFIIYMVLEKEGFDDLREIMKILDSFEVISKK